MLALAFAVCFAELQRALAGQTNDVTTRPANWAAPLVRPGLTNFYEVTTNLYRGAQPTAQGMAELKTMGIKTVLNLRSFHSDSGLVVERRNETCAVCT